MASVFISHSSRDGHAVDAIAAFLRDDEHHSVFLDRHPKDGIHVGEQWEQVLYDHLHAADVVVCVVTEHHVASRWCFAEVALAKALGRHVLPVGAQRGVRHPLLAPIQAIDYVSDPVAALEALGDRLRAIEAGGGAAWDPTRPLFPGLAPFDTSDAPVFFGRDAETERLASLIRSLSAQRTQRSVVVIGASGSGKSSLVRAGLVPRLLAEGWWALPPVFPGPKPLDSLAFAFAQAWKALQPERPVDLGALAVRVRDDIAGAGAELLLAAPGRRDRLLLIVDQFEELFTTAVSSEVDVFLTVLNQASQVGGPIAVVATMRSEFQGELLACEPAGRLREVQFPLAPLGRARLATIVRGPARKGRLELTDDLVQRLVEDTGSGEALPLLAYVLRRLTEHAGPGARIDVAEYEQIGGVQGALRTQADDALARAVDSTGHNATEILGALVALVSVDGSGRPTRRRVLRAAIAPDRLRDLDIFVEARLLSSDDVDGEPTLAVTHEALLTAWPQMEKTIESQAKRLQLERRLEQAADDWEQAGNEASILWRGEQLRQVSEYPGGWSARAQRFIDESLAADDEARHREADILADRLRASGLVERDSELALLLLLVAADEFAPTDAVIGGLRQTLARHRLIARIPQPDAQVTALAVSDDGDSIAVADLGTNIPIVPSTRPRPLPAVGQCRISVRRRKALDRVEMIWVPGRRITALAVGSNPGGLVVAAGVDDRIVVADGSSPASVTDDVSIGSGLRSVEVSRAGDRLVAKTVDDSVVVVDLTSEGLGPVTHPPEANESTPSGTGEGGRPRFSGSNHELVFDEGLWPEAFREAGWATAPAGSLLAYSVPALLAVNTDQYGIALHSVEPVDSPTLLAQVDGTVAALRWREDGTKLAVTTDGRFIDLATGLIHPSLGVVHAVSADGMYALIDDPLRIHEFASGSSQQLAAGRVRTAGFSEDGRRLAVAGWGSLTVFDVTTAQLVARFGEHDDEEGDTYTGVALSRDGTRLVSTSLGGGRSHIWDITTGQALRAVPAGLLDLSPDGADVVTRDFRDIAADLSAGVDVRLRAYGTDISLMVAPDRQTILMIRPDLGLGRGIGRVEEYTLPEGHPMFTDTGQSTAAAFSHDARHLLLARPDGRILMSALRDATDVLTRARSHVFRAITREDRASYALDQFR